MAEKPGDLFKTAEGAAKDFGLTYNGKSINEGQEYGSRIYIVVKDNVTYFTYTEPNQGAMPVLTQVQNLLDQQLLQTFILMVNMKPNMTMIIFQQRIKKIMIILG